jgi:regulation of enolase protein 1 (concanavalin A-like superfamily)
MCGAASAVQAAVPTPWLAEDVGAPSPAGTSTYNSGTFTITASGVDIWGTSDQFHFVYQQLSGDVDVVARVESLTNTNSWAKAGLMFRSSLSATAPEVFTGVTGSNGVTFQHRAASGQSSVSDGLQSGIGAPRWVRLVRAGDTITAYHATDGSQWTKFNAITLPLGTSIYVGLAVTSHASGVATTATASNVSVKNTAPSGVPAPQTAADIGSPATKGSTTYASGLYTISAGGSDIWSTSDQFHYVYQPVSGDVEIIARVTGVGAADSWSKSGVMIRESLAANSRHAFATVTAANGYVFQRRIDTGGYSATTSGGTGVAPGWVRLVRTGHKFDAYRSADGNSWTPMGSDTVPMADAVYVGLAVTSHNVNLGTTSTVNNLTIKSSTAPSTQPPTVTLTSPTSAATFTAPATIELSATASDPENRLSHVDFYAGTTLLNSDTTAPYSFSWSSVPAGTYALTAKAYDADGGTASSGAVTATVTAPTSTSPIAYVQSAYATPQTAQSTVGAKYGAAQTAADLNVVVIGWNDAVSHVVSVQDTTGNVYAPAAAPTVQTGVQTQVIYYAANIAAAAAGANTVTVTFDRAAEFPDVRIAEYRGIATTNPVDGAVGASGTGSTSNSGALTTSNASDLLVGADYVQSGTNAAGTNYTSRMITSPDGNILEDRIVTAAGSYNATASLSGSTGWVMQMVAFRGAGGAPAPSDTQAPTAPAGLAATAASSSQINLSWTASTDSTGVTGYRIERCQGAGCTSFAQVGTSTTTSYSISGLSASTSYSFRARATDAAGNLSAYSTVANATTSGTSSDMQPPTTPSNVTATASSSTQINLTWTAATDNVGVTGYVVDRCQGSGCTSFAQVGTPGGTSFTDTTGLVASTSYSYRVRARDAAGNVGAYSAVASVTTPGGSTTPKQVAFAASSDHSTSMVTGYRLEIFAASADPSTATPIATSDLGKPTPATNGDITVDRATFFSTLATGTYQATVSAYGSGGTSRSTPVTFTR